MAAVTKKKVTLPIFQILYYLIFILADINTMKEHMNTVHRQKNEVKCVDCGEEFRRPYLLDKHKNKCSTNEVFEIELYIELSIF